MLMHKRVAKRHTKPVEPVRVDLVYDRLNTNNPAQVRFRFDDSASARLVMSEAEAVDFAQRLLKIVAVARTERGE